MDGYINENNSPAEQIILLPTAHPSIYPPIRLTTALARKAFHVQGWGGGGVEQKQDDKNTHRFRIPILLAGAPALVGSEVVEDASLFEEQGALRALLVGVESAAPLKAHAHLSENDSARHRNDRVRLAIESMFFVLVQMFVARKCRTGHY